MAIRESTRDNGALRSLAYLLPALIWHGAGITWFVNWSDVWHNPPIHYTDYAFNYAELELLIGLVNGNDEHVLRFDQWLGFKEFQRFPKMHKHDGDLVMLAMHKADCRWLKEKEYGRRGKLSTSAA